MCLISPLNNSFLKYLNKKMRPGQALQTIGKQCSIGWKYYYLKGNCIPVATGKTLFFTSLHHLWNITNTKKSLILLTSLSLFFCYSPFLWFSKIWSISKTKYIQTRLGLIWIVPAVTEVSKATDGPTVWGKYDNLILIAWKFCVLFILMRNCCLCFALVWFCSPGNILLLVPHQM